MAAGMVSKRLSRAEMFKRLFPNVPVPYAKPGSLEAHQRMRAGLDAVFTRGEQIAGAIFGEDSVRGGGSDPRVAHNHEQAGSTPAPATKQHRKRKARTEGDGGAQG